MVRAHVHSDRALVAPKPSRRGEFESPVGSATSSSRPPAQVTAHQEPPTNDGDSRADTLWIVESIMPSFEFRWDQRPLESWKAAHCCIYMTPVPTAAPVPALPVRERPPGKRRGEDS